MTRAPSRTGGTVQAIERIMRYHAAIERSMFRAMHELEVLQMRRDAQA
jgi:hypothetical protein